MTEKQESFIRSLIDQLGYKNSEYRDQYYSKVLSTQNYYTGASSLINNLLKEKEIRYNPKKKIKLNNHINITDLSAFAFCPASYVISQNYEVEQTEKMNEGESHHTKTHLLNFLENIKKKRLREIETQSLDDKTKEKHLYRGSYGDLINSKLLFSGHTDNKEIFYNDKKTLAGVPDYIYENANKVKFVVEEKHTWQENKLTDLFFNHRIQVLGYLYGLKEQNFEYGYVVYFHWHYSKKYLTTSDPQIYEITKSSADKADLIKIYQDIKMLRNGKSLLFDVQKINIEKCFNCSVKQYCRHKSGLVNTIKLKY